MDPRVRTAFLLSGLFFCVGFAYLTIAVALRSSFDIFSLVSFLIIVLVASGLVGALRHPPDE
jgi:hypothetical protein